MIVRLMQDFSRDCMESVNCSETNYYLSVFNYQRLM